MRACWMMGIVGLLGLLATPAHAEGLLYVTSTPSGAQIVVDGQLTSHKTPVQLLLPGGVRRISVMKAGHHVADQRVKVLDGKVVRVQLTLSPAVHDLTRAPRTASRRKGKRRKLVVGSLSLVTDIIGADIALDGKPTGLKTPITVRVPVGRHTIRLSHGRAFVDQTVTIHKGNNAQIRVSLRPKARRHKKVAAPPRTHASDPGYPARRQACVKQCKYKAFIATCKAREAQCKDRCPGRIGGRIVNPGYYHPCADTCKSRRKYCLDSNVSACKKRCETR